MADCIPYKSIPYYTDLMLDYLAEKEQVKAFYKRFPSLNNLKSQLDEKADAFEKETRETLVSALKEQYRSVETSAKTRENIELLADEKTFTITTGHQLNLFTGPLYYFYKIISVIKLAAELKAQYPAYNFVPIFWMASEDHDFEEINFFNYKNKQLCWDSKQTGAVGAFSTRGLDQVYRHFKAELNDSTSAKQLQTLFQKAYLEQDSLAAATRFLGNEFFKEKGLVIVDGDDQDLKRVFAPYVEDELLQHTAHQQVTASAEKLSELGYKVQVNPREINLFYLKKGLRERLVQEGEIYRVKGTDLQFSKAEILKELHTHPERFSPNAIMRPLFQEVVLPNLCYVGGSGELAYWLELKAYFERVDVVFPSLLMRNSVLLMNQKQEKKRQKLGLEQADLFLSQADLLTRQTQRISAIPIDFSPQKKHLQQQFKDLYTLAQKTDMSFIGAVAAQEKKQLNGLDHLEKRLLKAQKRKLKDELARATRLQEELFPHGNLQERVLNFSVFYEAYGTELFDKLFRELHPLDMQFSILVI